MIMLSGPFCGLKSFARTSMKVGSKLFVFVNTKPSSTAFGDRVVGTVTEVSKELMLIATEAAAVPPWSSATL